MTQIPTTNEEQLVVYLYLRWKKIVHAVLAVASLAKLLTNFIL